MNEIRPTWCPRADCECRHSVQAKVCAGKLAATEAQEFDFEYAHRICLYLGGARWALLVNQSDVADLMSLLDAITTPPAGGGA